MTKSKKYFLFTVAGIAALIVVVIIEIPRTAWEGSRSMVQLLFRKNNNLSTEPPPHKIDEVSPVAAPVPNNVNDAGTAINVEPPKSHGVFVGPSLYKNSEFGFEFSIPEGWRATENPFGTSNSYFNMELEPLNGKAAYPEPVVINIAKKEFIAISFHGMKADNKPVTVDGLKGLRYEYAYEGGDNIDYILPRPQDDFLIGYRKGNDNIFKAIISSFKFTGR